MGNAEKASLGRKREGPMGLALTVSDRIELESVRLMSCNCEQLRLVGPGPKSFDIERNTFSEMDLGTNRVFVTVVFDLKMFESGTDKGKPFAVVKASFLLMYNANTLEGIADEALRLFGETNAVFNAWPYWREYVQNTTMRMILPPLTIPVFRIFAPEGTEDPKEKTSKKVVKKKTAKKTVKKKKIAKKKAIKA